MTLTRHDRFALDIRPERLRRLFDFDVDIDVGDTFRIEEVRDGDDLVVRAELPGINPETDVEVTVADGVLRVLAHRIERSEMKSKQGYRSEFHYGEMLRALPLPAGADEPGVKATYKSGILEVRVPIHEEHKPAVTHVAVTGD